MMFAITLPLEAAAESRCGSQNGGDCLLDQKKELLRQLLDRAAVIGRSRSDPAAPQLEAERDAVRSGPLGECAGAIDSVACETAFADLRISQLQTRWGLGDDPGSAATLICDGNVITAITRRTTAYSTATLLSGSDQAILVDDKSGGFAGEAATYRNTGTEIELYWPGIVEEPTACHPPEGAEAAGQRRLSTIDAICLYVDTSFVDASLRGLDWPALCAEARAEAQDADDAAFDRITSQLMSQLKTSHTDYLAPTDPTLAILYSVYGGNSDLVRETDRRGGKPLLRGSGFFTREVGGKVFVDQVLDGSFAENAGLKQGDEILDDDGAAFAAHWPGADGAWTDRDTDVMVRRHADGPELTLAMKITAGDALEVLAAATAASARIIEHDGKRIGYLHGWTMLTRPEVGGPAQEMSFAINDGIFIDADAVILDARGRVGGGGIDILEAYYSQRFHLGMRGRAQSDWHNSTFLPEDTPLVILIDDHTRSAAEIMAEVARNRKLATLVGSTTAGAVTGGKLIPLPDGGGLYLALHEIKVEGRILEGSGVPPDVKVPGALPYSAGHDGQFVRALEVAVSLAGKHQ